MEYDVYKLQETKPLQEGSNMKRFVEAMIAEHFPGVHPTNMMIIENGEFKRIQDIDPDPEWTLSRGDEIIIFSEWKGNSVIITKG